MCGLQREADLILYRYIYRYIHYLHNIFGFGGFITNDFIFQMRFYSNNSYRIRKLKRRSMFFFFKYISRLIPRDKKISFRNVSTVFIALVNYEVKHLYTILECLRLHTYLHMYTYLDLDSRLSAIFFQ